MSWSILNGLSEDDLQFYNSVTQPRQWIEGDERLHRRAEEIAGVPVASPEALAEKFSRAVQRAREEKRTGKAKA